MTNSIVQAELIHRKGDKLISEETGLEKEANKITNDNEEIRTHWQIVKYYFNRFRYYHFVVADTIDKYLSAACLWVLNMYFKLFWGAGPDLPSTFDEEN
ncbi:PREDICTED: uncharacterized protein LOC105368710 isoform X2 [Ceratosolen solmsi marchali]|nr:PREDICTED: uncharacterized protein LOC105368710 isoform X2 [Ceratosolen solmsi marchali]XP_011506093.1 PREDICTED: uncharacterized protein LOC105368710 isoform X2 [Ceratosolen solmsi marchali]